MHIRTLLAYCLLSQFGFAQNLVQTTDGIWRPIPVFLEMRERLEKNDIFLEANGALGINNKGKVVVVTCAHAFDDITGSERLSPDGICFELPGLEQDKDVARGIANWNPDKPVWIASFVPEQQRVVEVETHPRTTSLLEEVSATVGTIIRGNHDELGWEAYSEIPGDSQEKGLFQPGVSGSPLIQDGRIVGVVSWILHEPKGKYEKQIVGYSLFGQKPRSRALIYSTIILIPLSLVFGMLLITKLIRRRNKKKI